MATGWAGEGAVNEQIEATVKDAVERARSQLPKGSSLTHCAQCGEAIAEASGDTGAEPPDSAEPVDVPRDSPNR